MRTFVRALTIHLSCHLALDFALRYHGENISVQVDDGLEEPWQDEAKNPTWAGDVLSRDRAEGQYPCECRRDKTRWNL